MGVRHIAAAVMSCQVALGEAKVFTHLYVVARGCQLLTQYILVVLILRKTGPNIRSKVPAASRAFIQSIS